MNVKAYRRNRSPQQKENKEQPFFSKTNDRNPQNKKTQGAFFQTKGIKIGQPGDKYEQEADAVADAVVNHSDSSPQLQQKEITMLQQQSLPAAEEEKSVQAQVEEEEPIQAQEEEEMMQAQEDEEEEPIQAQAEEEEEPIQAQEEEEMMQAQEDEEEEPIQAQAEEEEEPIQAQEEEEMMQAEEEEEEEEEAVQAQEEEEPIQAKRLSGGTGVATNGLKQQLKNTKGQGHKLPKKARGEMEQAFGADFKEVSIHTDTNAIQMNKALSAQAFTHGRDIYFNSGRYNPENSAGKRLLAHELTHVVQQKQANSKKAQLKPGGGLSPEFPGKKKFELKMSSAPSPRITRLGGGTLGTIYFEQNSFSLSSENFTAVQKLGSQLKLMFGPSVLISGHASKEGKPDHNMQLSKMRNMAVESILSTMVDPMNKVVFTKQAFGESKPAFEEKGASKSEVEAQRRLNRRVEVLILDMKSEEPKKKLKLDLPEKTGPETLEERLNRIIKEKPPKPWKKRSVGELIENKLNQHLEDMLRKMNIPKKYRGHIKDAAIKGLKKGTTTLLDSALKRAGVDSKGRKAIKKATEAFMKTPAVR